MLKKGFTVIELLVVIAIIGILATATMMAVGFARERAKTVKAQHDLDVIYTAISTLANDTNEWPGHQPFDLVCTSGCSRVDDLAVEEAGLVLDDTILPFSGWSGPYMNSIPEDPWKHQYFLDTAYSTNEDGQPCAACGTCVCGPTAVVGSFGPDGLGDDSGNNANNEDDIIKVIAK